MPDLDLSALRKVAEAATPGPWTVPGPDDEFLNPRDVCTEGEPGDRFVICEHAGSDAQYIATFDPPTVLALLDELETLRALTKPPEVGFSSVGSGPIKGVQLRQVSDG